MQSTGWASLKLVLWARIHRVAMSCTKFCHLSPSQYFFTQALPTSAIARERWGTIGYNPFWMRILENTSKYDCLWWPIFLPFKCSRLWNKHRDTLINFWTFFQGLCKVIYTKYSKHWPHCKKFVCHFLIFNEPRWVFRTNWVTKI